MRPCREGRADVASDLQASTGPASAAPAVDEGSALLSMDEQEEAFIDTSISNGSSPGEPALAHGIVDHIDSPFLCLHDFSIMATKASCSVQSS